MPRIPELFHQPLAITEDKLSEIVTFYETWSTAKGAPSDTLAALRAQYPAQAEDPPPYELIDGVAVIPVIGVISKKVNLLSSFSGGTSIDKLTAAFKTALSDPSVDAIVLDVESPGGTVGGVAELSSLIYASRNVKPIVAYANGLMASAAYWIASAASLIVSEVTAQVGSIGVLTLHTDLSKSDETAGVKRTYLTAGKYKALGNDAEPLSEFARAEIQQRLDYTYSVFVSDVARNRNVTQDAALQMADGRIFSGQQAITAGLTDEPGTLQSAINKALKLTDIIPFRGGTTMAPVTAITTAEQLAAAYPDLVASVQNTAHNAALDLARADTAQATAHAASGERDRILGIITAVMPEADAARLATVITSGATPEIIKALGATLTPASAPISALEAVKAELLAALNKSGAPNPGSGGENVTTEGSAEQKVHTMTMEKMRANSSLTYMAASALVQKENPDLAAKATAEIRPVSVQ